VAIPPPLPTPPIPLIVPAAPQLVTPLLLVHGGAGGRHATLSLARERAARESLAAALRQGHAALLAGSGALAAVVAAVAVLEDAPSFNAGRGAVYAHEGHIELDAAVMDGASLRAGAVAGLRHVRNPVQLAQAVMERTPHVMLAGAGAEAFARAAGLPLVDASWFHTEDAWQQLQEALRQEQMGGGPVPAEHGTVGAVAIDAGGHLAAATSTGGMSNKRWGRIGDTPVIGAGTYANAQCAVSGTGWGEYYIRLVVAYDICSRVARGEPLAEAARQVINEELPRLGGDGGAIVLGSQGRVATPFNTELMYRGWIGADGEPKVAIHRGEGGPELSALQAAAL